VSIIPEYINSLHRLALVYNSLGEYKNAEFVLQKEIDIIKKMQGEDHPDFAICISNLAVLYKSMGEFLKAESLLLQSLQIIKKASGEDCPEYATSLNNLASVYTHTGAYKKAEHLYLQAMDIDRKTSGGIHPNYAADLNNLAFLYKLMGLYDKAEFYNQQALQIRKELFGEEHSDYAQSLNNLAMLYIIMGIFNKAELLLQKALHIRKKVYGEAHREYAVSLNNLAFLYDFEGAYEKAEPLYEQAIRIDRSVLGEDHPDYATDLNNLAWLYQATMRYEKAELLFTTVLQIRKKAFGINHPDYGESLNNLAGLYYRTGKFSKAVPFSQQALEISKAALGNEHPNYGMHLNNLAALYIASNRVEEGLELMKNASGIDDLMIGQIFSISSEEERLDYLSAIRFHLDVFFSFVFRDFSRSPQVIGDAFTLLQKRKAIALEAFAVQRDAILIGKYTHLSGKLDTLKNVRNQIARKTLDGSGIEGYAAHQRYLTELKEEKERMEKDLAHDIPEIRLEQNLRNADKDTIARILPPDSALLEFFRYNVYDFTAVPAKGEQQWKPARYGVFVLRSGDPESLSLVDIGEADQIDRLIALYKSGVSGPGTAAGLEQPQTVVEIKEGLNLFHALIAPFRSKLENCSRLIIAPDGEISIIPFEVIPVPEGGHLIDLYHISYTGVGRDVIRLAASIRGTAGNALVLASPDFDLHSSGITTSRADSSVSGRISRDFSRQSVYFPPLPATRVEGTSVGNLLGVRPLLEQEALEARLKSASSPRVLHIATHGFFLTDQELSGLIRARNQGAFGCLDKSHRPVTGSENPMLRSGLALAGVNTWLNNGNLHPEAEDGILTAEDVTGLDLSGTDLAVLSACDTGLGDVKTGEGVFGLRRAFALAGAKTLVMSLWKVPDKPTQELMSDFYRRLLMKTTKADALREAQIELRKRYPHPKAWGAFICQGDIGLISDIH